MTNRKIIEWAVSAHDDPKEIMADVNKALGFGWELFGSFSVTHYGHDAENFYFCQQMVMYEDEPGIVEKAIASELERKAKGEAAAKSLDLEQIMGTKIGKAIRISGIEDRYGLVARKVEHVLAWHNIYTLQDLTRRKQDEILSFDNFGKKSFDLLQRVMKYHGVSFA